MTEPEPQEERRLAPPASEADCRLIGAGDGSVMVYCQPCHSCLAPNVATLNAAAGIWEEHLEAAHEPQPQPCGLCGRLPAEGEQHRQLYSVGETGEDAEEVCVGPDRRQLAYLLPAPDPWALPESPGGWPPPPF